MKILLEIYLAENLGDDLFLKMILERYPNVTWYIFCQNKAYKYNFLSEYKNVRLIRLPKIIYTVLFRTNLLNIYHYYIMGKLNLSATVSIGGSIFMEIKGWKRLYERRRFLWSKFKSNGKKNFVLGSNFGPHKDENFVLSYNELFKELEDICFRDSYSYSLFPELNNVRNEPDIIFSLEANTQKKIENSIGISLISLENRLDLINYKEIYIEKMVEIINHYNEKKKQVTLISFCQIEGDEEIINDILNRINKADTHTLFYRGNIESFLQEISSIEKFITCRFHSLILAYILNSKFYPIIYSKKTSDIISDYNLSNSMTFIEEIDKLTIEEIEFEFENNKGINKSILDKSERQFWELDKFIGLKSGESI
ncbi:polysaccharide pyruvyl transferase family protein [Paenibacillus odorifer]|uniref:polysaccharide pyruvyl transferase family protein n=1 Tax=Paenibacillus odorifer TaxID=189426 RepID=UPI0004F9044D|nr:polysaccharide pyruvyl transferase family protein [Paenibacillus odorifer]AIQ76183.1 hypothetical protein PODO_24665 [Paenibacillus odorifer]